MKKCVSLNDRPIMMNRHVLYVGHEIKHTCTCCKCYSETRKIKVFGIIRLIIDVWNQVYGIAWLSKQRKNYLKLLCIYIIQHVTQSKLNWKKF